MIEVGQTNGGNQEANMTRTRVQDIYRQAGKLLIAALIVCGLVWTLPASASASVTFPAEFKDHGVTMELQGVALKRVLMVKAFEAGLYKERGADLLNGAKNIRVNYFVSIPGHKLSEFTIKTMKKNVSAAEFQSIQPQVDRMRHYFVDLKPGDLYELLYIPGVGIKFVHNGNVVGVIEGEDFAQALYAVWIGDKPFDNKIKEKILGSADSSATRSRVAKR